MEKDRDITKMFSYDETCLIKEFINKHKAVIHIDESKYTTIKSQSLEARFSLGRKNNRRVVKVCVIHLGNIDNFECFDPSELKKALEL